MVAKSGSLSSLPLHSSVQVHFDGSLPPQGQCSAEDEDSAGRQAARSAESESPEGSPRRARTSGYACEAASGVICCSTIVRSSSMKTEVRSMVVEYEWDINKGLVADGGVDWYRNKF